MIKGMYKAIVTFDFHMDTEYYNVVPFESIKTTFEDRFTDELKDLLQGEMGDDATITVEQQMLDLYVDEED